MHQASRRKLLKSSELLQIREIHGRSIVSNKYRCNFEQEYQKLQAKYPMVIWTLTVSSFPNHLCNSVLPLFF